MEIAGLGGVSTQMVTIGQGRARVVKGRGDAGWAGTLRLAVGLCADAGASYCHARQGRDGLASSILWWIRFRAVRFVPVLPLTYPRQRLGWQSDTTLSAACRHSAGPAAGCWRSDKGGRPERSVVPETPGRRFLRWRRPCERFAHTSKSVSIGRQISTKSVTQCAISTNFVSQSRRRSNLLGREHL